MIVIIDYGLGNILAFANIYKRLNIPVIVADSADKLRQAKKIILPGVGAFDHAMERLNGSGMRETLVEMVLSYRTPVLGVCVGMQMMAYGSDEGKFAGLKWINGYVKKFDVSVLPRDTYLPHMGWNDVVPCMQDALFLGLENDARFYFLHSYYFSCESNKNVLAVADYGGQFSCAVKDDHIYGVQFHPEKSHHYGVKLLKNFAEL